MQLKVSIAANLICLHRRSLSS